MWSKILGLLLGSSYILLHDIKMYIISQYISYILQHKATSPSYQSQATSLSPSTCPDARDIFRIWQIQLFGDREIHCVQNANYGTHLFHFYCFLCPSPPCPPSPSFLVSRPPATKRVTDLEQRDLFFF